jgi:hypothetical protein
MAHGPNFLNSVRLGLRILLTSSSNFHVYSNSHKQVLSITVAVYFHRSAKVFCHGCLLLDGLVNVRIPFEYRLRFYIVGYPTRHFLLTQFNTEVLKVQCSANTQNGQCSADSRTWNSNFDTPTNVPSGKESVNQRQEIIFRLGRFLFKFAANNYSPPTTKSSHK